MREPEWARVTEKSRESQSGTLRPPSPSKGQAQIEAVLSRSVEIQYFLLRKMSFTCCERNEEASRSWSYSRPEEKNVWKNSQSTKLPLEFLNEPRIKIKIKLFRLLLSCYEGAMISSILHCQANINTHTNMLKNANTNVLKNSNLVLPGKCKHNDKHKQSAHRPKTRGSPPSGICMRWLVFNFYRWPIPQPHRKGIFCGRVFF